MKFTLDWLSDHLDHSASLEEIAERLTMTGFEVEGLEDSRQRFAPFVTALVEACEPHPQADRLKCCKVNTGEAVFDVVCGAPNARKGMIGIFAPAGSHIPGTGLDLKPTKIRGALSEGMLCSAKELMLSDDHDGILELPEKTKPGQSFATLYGLDEVVIDIAITPNRGDCLGVRGVARDLVASGLGTLKPMPVRATALDGFGSPLGWKLEFASSEQAKNCDYVAGRYFRNVKNGPSPEWMQKRLRALGLKPVSTLVDITNYITLDLGRPLHVFDADKIEGSHLTIGPGRKGDKLHALDDREYALTPSMMVITDEKKTVSLAGIMGGMETGCSDDTVNVFLEVALFAPMAIAETGRELKIDSDARMRFERGVDPHSVTPGLVEASHYILELCGGEVSAMVEAGKIEDARKAVELTAGKLASLSGTDIPLSEAETFLKRLGFEVSVKGEVLSALPPSWRSDIKCDACLIEEIMRLYGYDNFPAIPFRKNEAGQAGAGRAEPVISARHQRLAAARRMLAARGYYEALSWSFCSEAQAAFFAPVDEKLRLLNPISTELSIMRPSILASLLPIVKTNRDENRPDCALFEAGPAFLEKEFLSLGGLRVGLATPRHWTGKERDVDIYDVQADLFALFEAFGLSAQNIKFDDNAPDYFHPGRRAGLFLGRDLLGFFGELHPLLGQKIGIKARVMAFEAFLEHLPEIKSRNKPAKQSKFQPVQRDFAFLIEKSARADDIIRAARAADKKAISDISIFDIYEGEDLPQGKRSIAFTVTLQPGDKTFTEEDIDAISGRIVETVGKKGGQLRGPGK